MNPGVPRRVMALVAALLSMLSMMPERARAATDPERVWFTLQTEHFAVHSYDEGLDFARRVARLAEEAYDTLNPLLGWTPSERVHIRVLDDQDSANGFASVAPYDGITLLAFPPGMDSDLAYADDWLRLLVFHEYSHIVHLDNATGVPAFLNAVFGKMLKPNQSLPRWFTEGVATWAETHTTGGGRVGSPRYQMVLRMAALADRLPSIDAITGAPLELPRAMSWYLYGSTLMDHLVRSAGVDSLRAYLRAYGRRLIPYAMNTLARQHTGKDLVAWWEEMREEVTRQARLVKERVEAAGRLEGTQRTRSGEHKLHPRFTPDGSQLLYVRADGHSEPRLVMAPLDRLDTPTTVAQCDGGCGRFEVSRDGRSIYLSTVRPYRRVNAYRDIVSLPLALENRRGSELRITRGARMGDPSISADGRRLWGVSAAWGETWVQAIDPATGDVIDRWSPPKRARVDRPIVHPDGRRLFLSMHHEANRDLVEVDLRDGTWRRLTYGASMETDLTLSRDGRWLVYSSDMSGVHNLYARDVSGAPDAEGRVYRLTNVLGGAFEPCLSPDGETLAYVGWTAKGEEIFTLPFRPTEGLPSAQGDGRAPRPNPTSKSVSISAPEPYEPLATLLPRTWFPTLAYDTTGLTSLGVRLRGVDITDRIGGSIGFQWDIPRGEVAASIGLGLRYGHADFDLTLGRYSRDLSAHYGDSPRAYREEVYHAQAGVSVAMPHPIAPMSFSASLSAEVFRGIAFPPVVHTPDSTSPEVPTEGVNTSVRLTWRVDTTRSDPWSITRSRGGDGKLSLRFSLPELGADRTSYELTYRIRRYLTMPWLSEHVLSLGLRGGFAGGLGDEAEHFDIGGVPRRDLVTDLLSQAHAGPVWLRGFVEDAFSGPTYHLATVEYRFPLFRWRRGLGTLPVFARDLTAAFFSDVAWIGPERLEDASVDDLRAGLGVELRMTTDLLFGFAARFRVGYAYGFGPQGVHHLYVLMAPPP